jgi:hydroxycarboxylate dehydrogenase B
MPEDLLRYWSVFSRLRASRRRRVYTQRALRVPLFIIIASSAAIQAMAAGRCPRTIHAPPTARWHMTETANFRIYAFGTAPVTPQLAAQCETMRACIIREWFNEDAATPWNPKCTLVLPRTLASYRAAVGRLAECTAAACTTKAEGEQIVVRRIDARTDRANWWENLPHELVHLAIQSKLPSESLPRWIDEGMATMADPRTKQALHLRDLQAALAAGRQFRLVDLLTLEDYPAADRLAVFYGQSLSLLNFLVDRAGRQKVVEFARLVARDGYDHALALTYDLANIAQLETAWNEYVRKRSLAQQPGSFATGTAAVTLSHLPRCPTVGDAHTRAGLSPMLIQKGPLERLVTAIFQAAGSDADEAAAVSEHLVEANLVGHDSHGVIRIVSYINWVRENKIVPNQTPRTVLEAGSIGVLDGQLGYGQVMARHATDLAIKLARQHGIAAVALFNSGHVGRVGAWATLAAEAGLVSLSFVNTSGGGILVAPTGGIDRRLSANPIAIAVPVRGAKPLLVDMSTCAIAEGKIRVAFNKGQLVPDNSIIDAEGKPTNDPRVFYADPPGAILPVGGHKGFGLGVMVEMLAGALTGGGCSRTGVPRLEQAMFTITIDPLKFQNEDTFANEVRQYIDFVKSSRTVTPDGEILMPGEPEELTRFARTARGIELDDMTWGQITQVAETLKVPVSDYV